MNLYLGFRYLSDSTRQIPSRSSVPSVIGAMTVLTALITAPSMVWSAGSHDGGHDDGFSFGKPGDEHHATRTVEIEMRDNAYSISEFMAQSGETVKFVLINKDDFEHEFVIGPSDMMAEHRREMQAMLDGDGHMDHNAPNAVTIAANETQTFVWSFGNAGDIEFACNIPGHYEAGMHGDLHITNGAEDTPDH